MRGYVLNTADSYDGGPAERTNPAPLLRRCLTFFALLLGLLILPIFSFGLGGTMRGTVSDPAGMAIANATIELVDQGGDLRITTSTDGSGHFLLEEASPGAYRLIVKAAGFQDALRALQITADEHPQRFDFTLSIRVTETVTATSDVNQVDLFSPDPAEKVFVQQDLLDANPGRPGAPVSIPGYPIETASGGIKAPQYFAPGVAGDHGEPIAQFIAVGGYLLPNNLSANAHGNGYADPNLLISSMLADVQVDGGSFNVLEGNHAVNLAATYGLRTHAAPFLSLSGDYRDLDLASALSFRNTSWIAAEALYGNGFLQRLEHRQQYKINGERIFEAGQHQLTLLAIGYFGTCFIPGLVPLNASTVAGSAYEDSGDTVDPRQREQTHTALVALNDEWTPTSRQQLQFSGFFRTYNLSLFSDFGQGLIRQSEFRTVAAANATYANRVNDQVSVLGGIDVEREAPRRVDLDHYDFYTPGNMSDGSSTPVTENDVTILLVSPYIAAQGEMGSHVRYYTGWRHDQIEFDNRDKLQSANSFREWDGVDSPKATVSVVPGSAKWAPLVSASAGESFFTEDPRIGTGNTRGNSVSRAHSYQLVTSKAVARTDLKLTLGQVTTGEQLAKIDPDTGLQENQGPGRVRFVTAALRQNFTTGSILATFSKADARDILSGQPTAEAPRTLFDILGVTEKLPLRLKAKGEFEYVGAKPLGTGCNPNPTEQCLGVPVKELRAAVARPFQESRFNVGVNFLLARGYTGQTLENFYPSFAAVVTGVRIPSYASISFTYRFQRPTTP